MDGMCTAYGDGAMGNTWFQFNKTLTFPGPFWLGLFYFFFPFFPPTILWLVTELGIAGLVLLFLVVFYEDNALSRAPDIRFFLGGR